MKTNEWDGTYSKNAYSGEPSLYCVKPMHTDEEKKKRKGKNEARQSQLFKLVAAPSLGIWPPPSGLG
jgi:hypothetical protein